MKDKFDSQSILENLRPFHDKQFRKFLKKDYLELKDADIESSRQKRLILIRILILVGFLAVISTFIIEFQLLK